MTRKGEKRQLVPEDSGVYLAPAEKQSLQAIAAASECVWIRVDLQAARDKAELLAQRARQLEFPAHFGANWDAFADCVRDLSWLPARGYVIDCANMNHFIESAERDASCSWMFCARPLMTGVHAAEFLLCLSIARRQVSSCGNFRS